MSNFSGSVALAFQSCALDLALDLVDLEIFGVNVNRWATESCRISVNFNRIFLILDLFDAEFHFLSIAIKNKKIRLKLTEIWHFSVGCLLTFTPKISRSSKYSNKTSLELLEYSLERIANLLGWRESLCRFF